MLHEVSQLLTDFEPHDDQEAAHKATMLGLLDAGEDAFRRHHIDPGHFTASAFVLSPDRSAMVLIHHGKLHRWLQPGGHIEAGDASLIDAARREVAEETGLSDLTVVAPLFDLDVHTIPAAGKAPEHAHHDLRVLFQAPRLGGVAGSDARDLAWVSLDAVGPRVAEAAMVRVLQKLRLL